MSHKIREIDIVINCRTHFQIVLLVVIFAVVTYAAPAPKPHVYAGVPEVYSPYYAAPYSYSNFYSYPSAYSPYYGGYGKNFDDSMSS